MMELVSFTKWDRIIKIPYRMSTYFMLYHLYRLKNKKKQIHNIFVGYPKTRTFQWFCENLDPSNCILLDEGVFTIQAQRDFFFRKNYLQGNDFLNNNLHSSFISRYRHWIKLYIKNHLFGLSGTHKIKYDLFTCFDLEMNVDQKCIHNNYTYTKSKVSQIVKLDNTVFFYSSPLSEVGIVTFDVEMKILSFIHEHYEKRGKKIFYIPHPSDSKEKLEYIQDHMDIKIRQSTSMAEIDPIKSKQLPSDIASCLSTTLHTLGNIYNFESIKSFRIPNELIIHDGRREAIQKLYSEYEKNIEMVYLEVR